MSHFTTIKTQLKNKNDLVSALEKMESIKKIDTLKKTVRGFAGIKENVDFAAYLSQGEIGFKKEAGGYSVVADWYGIRHSQGALMDEIRREYAEASIMRNVRRRGLGHTKTRRKDGSIVIKVRSY